MTIVHSLTMQRLFHQEFHSDVAFWVVEVVVKDNAMMVDAEVACETNEVVEAADHDMPNDAMAVLQTADQHFDCHQLR